MKTRTLVAGWMFTAACLAGGALLAQSHPDGGRPGQRVGQHRDGGMPGERVGQHRDGGAATTAHHDADAGAAHHDAGATPTTAHDGGTAGSADASRAGAQDCRTMRCPAGQRCEMQQVMCVRAPCPPIARCVPAAAGH